MELNTQEYYDKKISEFLNDSIIYRNKLIDFLDTFMPLSNEDQERDLKLVRQKLNRYIKQEREGIDPAGGRGIHSHI